jgi:hypothetical protein
MACPPRRFGLGIHLAGSLLSAPSPAGPTPLAQRAGPDDLARSDLRGY